MKNKLITFIFALLFIGLLFSFAHSVSAIYPTLYGKILFLCANCLNYLLPLLQKTIIFLSSIAILSLIVSILKTINFSQNIKKLNNRSVVVKEITEKYSLQSKIIIFKHSNPVAFCMGVLKPKIYLSNYLLKKMTALELETIILHERQHLNRNDNLILLLLQMIKNTFFFLPIIGDFVNYFHIKKEIIADKGVIKILGQNYSLISSLRKVIDSPSINIMSVNTFSQSYDIELRIQSLLGKKIIKNNFHFNNLVLSLSVLLLIANVFVSKIEAHSQSPYETSICLDKGNCQNMCQ